ncbi:MAG TPA: amidohydrolase family protein [Vicinamibacterales bacterium]|nr:amidohydrolase family protein [Vicinamibacterales bacterium]
MKAALALSLVVALGGWSAQSGAVVALVGGAVYTSPQAARMDDAAIVLRDGRIAAIGRRADVTIPSGARVIDCTGRTIVAGFWNSHVHFMEDAWNDAERKPAAALEAHMQAMLTRWGFTTVFDLGSAEQNTIALTQRVQRGEVKGPKIYRAGPIYPEHGVPVYVPEPLASLMKPMQAATSADATRLATQYLANGADGIKLFAGSIVGRGEVRVMPVDVARAAVQAAHAAGKPVFAHPSNHAGADSALAAGVNVLTHPISMDDDGFTSRELEQMKAGHVALIPTLTLWEVEAEKEGATPEQARAFVQVGIRGVMQYVNAGGTILFGTDVGYTPHYDTAEEFVLMERAGLTWRAMLASLTTAPVAFFKADGGELAPGKPADLVVLAGDPSADARNFARVTYTIRGGRVIYP